MRYTTEVTIGLPRAKVVELFDSTENLYKWQAGLKAIEPISGTRGQPGATSRMVFHEGDERVELIETITSRNLPNELAVTYESKGIINHMDYQFHEEEEEEKTRVVVVSEYRFSGFMKLVAPFMGDAFTRETASQMSAFKEFAESLKTQP